MNSLSAFLASRTNDPPSGLTISFALAISTWAPVVAYSDNLATQNSIGLAFFLRSDAAREMILSPAENVPVGRIDDETDTKNSGVDLK